MVRMTAMALDVREFAHRLHELDREAILAVAAHLVQERATTAGEVAWWEDTLAVQGILRTHRASRSAARAAHEACAAVQHAARRNGMALPHEGVTMVARAAGEVARALVAEAVSGEAAVAVTDRLMAPFSTGHRCEPMASRRL